MLLYSGLLWLDLAVMTLASSSLWEKEKSFISLTTTGVNVLKLVFFVTVCELK
jgi:hypothetical protein